jgi:hypothetical protein
MKRKSIVFLTVLSLFAGIANESKAQDSTLTLSNYLFKTPWMVGFGPSYVMEAPLGFKFKATPYYADKTSYMPARVSFEKDLYGFRHWNHTQGMSLQGIISRHGFQPMNFYALDFHLKYDLNNAFGDTKWFDPYASFGFGLSSMFHDYVYIQPGGVPAGLRMRAVGHDYSRNNAITTNLGVGFNMWINELVAINVDAIGKMSILGREKKDNIYAQASIGLVMKIGGCKKADLIEAPKPVSTYKRTQEEEDALIHLREHLKD